MNNTEKFLIGLAIFMGVLQFVLLGNPSALIGMAIVYIMWRLNYGE